MKRSTIRLVALLMACGSLVPSCADRSRDGIRLHPPEAITRTLDTRFPGADLRAWSEIPQRDSSMLYEAEFAHDRRHYLLRLSDSAGILGWQKRLRLNEIPEEVKNSVREKCSGAPIREALEITTLTSGKELRYGYRVECELEKRRLSNGTTETHTRIWYLTPDGRETEDWRAESNASAASCVR